MIQELMYFVVFIGGVVVGYFVRDIILMTTRMRKLNEIDKKYEAKLRADDDLS